MGYFSNRTVNYLNVNHALITAMDQSCGLFLPIFLYTKGFTLTQVFLFIGCMDLLRIPGRLLGFPLVRRFGLKGGLLVGAAGYGLSYPVLGMVKGVDGWMLLYFLLFSISNAVHWHCFHTFYSVIGEREKRGRHVAAGRALGICLTAAAPVTGGFIIAGAGYHAFFLLAVPITLGMLLAISRCQNIALDPAPWKEGKTLAFNFGSRIHIAEAYFVFLGNVPWVLTVYLYVNSTLSFGGIVTFGVIAQALWLLLLGSHVDRGRGQLITYIAHSLRALRTVLRAYIPLSLPAILTTETVAALGEVHYVAIQPTAMYNAGKASAHPFWFWFFAESAYDLGTGLGAALACGLLWWGVPLRHIILAALPAVLVCWWLLGGHYRKAFHDAPT